MIGAFPVTATSIAKAVMAAAIFVQMQLLPYDPSNWYWEVGNDTSRVYSSARANYVSRNDPAFVEWTKNGGVPTKIKSEADLRQVFVQQYPEGWRGEAIKQKARKALADSDEIILGMYENDMKVPADWRKYRSTLRAIVNGQPATDLPLRPPVPPGL